MIIFLGKKNYFIFIRNKKTINSGLLNYIDNVDLRFTSKSLLEYVKSMLINFMCPIPLNHLDEKWRIQSKKILQKLTQIILNKTVRFDVI